MSRKRKDEINADNIPRSQGLIQNHSSYHKTERLQKGMKKSIRISTKMTDMLNYLIMILKQLL